MKLGQGGVLVIEDRHTGRIEITGTLIGRIDTREGAPDQQLERPRTRWGVNTVIKLADGSYVLAREAFSLVYHTHPTSCMTITRTQKGEPASVDDLPDDAMPCWICHPRPPEDLGDRERIRFEFPRRSIDQCENPGQVISQLMVSRKHSGIRKMELPDPARALLAQCQEHDQAFTDAGTAVVRIG